MFLMPRARQDWRSRQSGMLPGPGRYRGIGPWQPEAGGRDRKDGRRCEAAGRPTPEFYFVFLKYTMAPPRIVAWA